jgi:nucleotide-binding universal stress UspA family protein
VHFAQTIIQIPRKDQADVIVVGERGSKIYAVVEV